MPARVMWTKERVNELHAFLANGWRHQDGTYKKGYKVAAAERFGVSDDNIFDVLKQFPKPIQREPKTGNLTLTIYENFLDDPTVKDFIKARHNSISPKKLQDYIRAGFMAWKALEKKNLLAWTEDDFKNLWEIPAFHDEVTGKISFAYASGLRNWMVHVGLDSLPNKPYFTTKGLKRPAGSKKTHYIKSVDESVAVINAIEFPDTLIMFDLGIQCGARWSSLSLTKPENIDYSALSIHMTEPKLRRVGKSEVEREFIRPTLDILRQYIYDNGYRGNDLIFPAKLGMINRDLKQAGKKAGLDFDLTSHVAMKHTFVSFACNHGVSLDTVSIQAHTDPNTLMMFYAGIGKGKKRHELLGEEYKEPDYGAAMAEIQPYVKVRYEQIKHRRRSEAKSKQMRARQAKGLPWASFKGMANSPKTKPHVAAALKEAIALHEKGLSDAEVQKKMGWKTKNAGS